MEAALRSSECGPSSRSIEVAFAEAPLTWTGGPARLSLGWSIASLVFVQGHDRSANWRLSYSSEYIFAA